MALYRHVPSKDALLDGVVEMLWAQVPPPPRRRDQWAEPLRSYAHDTTLLANLRDAGFEESHAAQILRSVISTALGDALSTLTYQALAPSPAAQPDTWISITQALSPDTPPDLVRAAHAVCACEPDADFTFILDLILSGAQELKRPT